jgi:hypothetical protein
MSRQAVVALLLVAVVSLPSAARTPRPQPASQPAAVLVFKGEGYLVHSLPVGPLMQQRFERYIESGVTLTHTALPSGQMKVLASTGLVAINTERISYDQTRVAGLARDDRYLYMLVAGRRSWDQPPDSPRAAGRAWRILVTVHNLTDGKEVGRVSGSSTKPGGEMTVRIDGVDQTLSLPEDFPEETTGSGQFQSSASGVSLWGMSIQVKDGQLKCRIEQAASSPASQPAGAAKP